MDPRIHQLIAADRLQRDIRAAAAARAAKAASDLDAGTTRGRFRRRPPIVTTGRFVRRSQSSITADR